MALDDDDSEGDWVGYCDDYIRFCEQFEAMVKVAVCARTDETLRVARGAAASG